MTIPRDYDQGPYGDQLPVLKSFNASRALTLREAMQGSGISWRTATAALDALLEYNMRLLTPEPRPNFERAGDETAFRLTPFAER